jgi:DNA-binding response OmpR family regulator
LVEDNPGDVQLVIEALEDHQVSCDLLVVTNGEQAAAFLDDIDAGKQPCPSLFILDLNLPRRPGTEILERMRTDSTCQHVPVVVLTSSDSQKDKMQWQDLILLVTFESPRRRTGFCSWEEFLKGF